MPIPGKFVSMRVGKIVNERGRKRVLSNALFPLLGVWKCDCGHHLTASFCKGKKNYYKYYSCYKERNKNYRCETLDAMVNDLLQHLSFTDAQVARIRAICEGELTGKEDHSQKQISVTKNKSQQ